jgi:hypothetical protein
MWSNVFEPDMSLRDKADELGSWMNAWEAQADTLVDEKVPNNKLGRAAQSGTVLNVVVLGVIAIIGILIYSQIQTSLPSPNNSQLDNASTNVTDGFADAMNLLPVVFVVLVAALVIAVVQRFRG